MGGHWLTSSRRSSPFEPSQALEVISQVRHADLDGGAGDADGAHEQPHPVLLPGEHMLDLGADLGTPGIGLGDPLRQRSLRLIPARAGINPSGIAEKPTYTDWPRLKPIC